MPSTSDIRRGMKIIGHNGRKLGRVTAVKPDGFHARDGFLVRRRFFVPSIEIESVGSRSVTVRREAGAMHIGANALEEARMDSAKFQKHWVAHDWQSYEQAPTEGASTESAAPHLPHEPHRHGGS